MGQLEGIDVHIPGHQRINITDCLSFALMERLGLDTAMTFDSDLRTHGFKVVI